MELEGACAGAWGWERAGALPQLPGPRWVATLGCPSAWNATVPTPDAFWAGRAAGTLPEACLGPQRHLPAAWGGTGGRPLGPAPYWPQASSAPQLELRGGRGGAVVELGFTTACWVTSSQVLTLSELHPNPGA